MAQTVEIDPGRLVPGDTIRFEYELLTDNMTVEGLAVKAVKDRIWADDRLDYQGSETEDRVDLETGKTSRILSIYATVRRTRRSDRGDITYVELSNVEAYGRLAAELYGQSVKYSKALVIRGAQWVAASGKGVVNAAGDLVEGTAEAGKAVAKALPAISVAALLIAAVFAYKFFLGSPSRG